MEPASGLRGSAKNDPEPVARGRAAVPPAPHAAPFVDVLQDLQVSPGSGLAEEEIMERRQRHGANIAHMRSPTSAWRLLLHQFNSPIVYLLSAAAALALYARQMEEAIAVLAVLAINGAIGFATELRAIRSIAALRRMGTHSARVKRDGLVRLLPAQDLVPGDIVILEAGDAVPAEIRIIEAANLRVDESLLTGESITVEKTPGPVPAETRLGDRACMLHKGTALTQGSALGVVVAIGARTEIGRIARLIEEADPGHSPLERKLARLSRQLVVATFVIAGVIALLGVLGGRDIVLILEAAIALAVAAIPEGLPIVATLALARGMWRMARQNALVERLSAVETLGATTVILTDKTGTLTENRMTVRRLHFADGEVDLAEQGADPALARLVEDPQAVSLLRIAVLCNGADLAGVDETGSGDPMEVALLRAGLLAGQERNRLLVTHRLVRTEPFDPRSRMMATVHESGDGFLVAAKGAPEAIVSAASRVVLDHRETDLSDALRAEWLAEAETFGHHGLRVLACAMKMETRSTNDPFDDLVLIGLIGLEDPARADVPGAIADCLAAGIRVVMVTGDHATTARSIAHAVGLAQGLEAAEGDAVETVIEDGPAALARIGIFARVSPEEKLALVKAYQAAGEIVAMTGDGVNDAPALRQADIGVAMGLRGTDVAREAAAMVLLDDAFPTIVKAIREGRVIFGNIRRFVVYLLSCNLSEVLVVAAAVLFGLPLPLLPLQILYLNLVTDIFPAFALAMGEGEHGVLRQPPRKPAESILGADQWGRIVLFAATLTGATLAAVVAGYWFELSETQAVTVSFLTLAFAQVWHVFNMRSVRAGLLVNEITGNIWIWIALVLCGLLLVLPPYFAPLAGLLGVAPPDRTMWTIVLACSLAPLVILQTGMLLRRFLVTTA